MTRQHKLILSIMIMGAFLGNLCSSMMNTAIPQLMHAFAISSARVQWVSNGYMLANALMIPVSSYLIKRYSYRRLFITFAAIFTVGTIIGSLAASFTIIVAGRMVQAIGAGIMMPLVNVMAIHYATAGHQGRVMGIIGLAFNFAPLLGPSVSGLLLDYFNWRYLFILIVPFGLLTIILSIIFLPSVANSVPCSFNLRGLILCSFSLFFLLEGCSNIGSTAFLTWRVGGILAAGLILLALFVATQWNAERPFVNLRVFTHRDFRIATITNCLLVATMYGNTILLPLLVQNVMHYSPFISGLVIFPGAVSTGILSPLSGNLFDRFPVRWLVTTGLIIDLIGTAMQAFVGVRSGVVFVAFWQWIRQLGIVLLLIPLQTEALSIIPKEELPDGVALFNTTRQVAASFGMAVVVAVVNLRDRGLHLGTSRVGIQAGFLTCFAILLLALFLSRHLGAGSRQAYLNTSN
ncbi:MDR family MFS transporter [Limosilactobacillus sp.]|uniref:MDR family MFS transporter n=1 Tax=Limosilactobacillus sp. TaxID=2773925 RepID=UPI0025C07450|nr:MDR family MFS transporter [Limosilactobacillus sp.]MCH3922038.1 multidrug efflux MFS transporter [Limosilactobacillus sp.]MCH3928809.1 multidrug efflux MFS transporter [Limosilactobacillus sp.]